MLFLKDVSINKNEFILNKSFESQERFFVVISYLIPTWHGYKAHSVPLLNAICMHIKE